MEPENGRIQHDYAKFVLQKGDFDEAIQLYIHQSMKLPTIKLFLKIYPRHILKETYLKRLYPIKRNYKNWRLKISIMPDFFCLDYYLLKEETKATALLEALKTSLSPFFYHMLALTQASYLSPIQKQASTTIEHIQSILDGSIQPVHISHPAFSLLYKQVYQPTQPKTLMKKFNTIFSTPSISLSQSRLYPRQKPKVGLCL